MLQLGVDLSQKLQESQKIYSIQKEEKHTNNVQTKCQDLCQKFKELFQPGLGCLKDCELEIKFKEEALTCSGKVPFAIMEDLNQTL